MIGAVTACEMINSAIDATVDLVTSEIKPLAIIHRKIQRKISFYSQ